MHTKHTKTETMSTMKTWNKMENAHKAHAYIKIKHSALGVSLTSTADDSRLIYDIAACEYLSCFDFRFGFTPNTNEK